MSLSLTAIIVALRRHFRDENASISDFVTMSPYRIIINRHDQSL